jgi:hypothetical protein
VIESITSPASDHHLDEIADMIEQSHADNASLETPFSGSRRVE